MVITLLTDFGLRDPYVAEMKAVILSINPSATIVDITHLVEPFNVRMGAFLLASAYRYFPKGSIHVGVVDPGVGGRRRPLLIKSRNYAFIGPDNGLLALAAKLDGVEEAYEITNPRLMLPEVSKTFHGRDIFAPVAAHLSLGVEPSEVGERVQSFKEPSFARPRLEGSRLLGEVLYIDNFGNVVTNIAEELVKELGAKAGDELSIQVGECEFRCRFVKYYSMGEPGELLSLVGSHGFLEISVNLGKASERVGARLGDLVAVERF